MSEIRYAHDLRKEGEVVQAGDVVRHRFFGRLQRVVEILPNDEIRVVADEDPGEEPYRTWAGHCVLVRRAEPTP